MRELLGQLKEIDLKSIDFQGLKKIDLQGIDKKTPWNGSSHFGDCAGGWVLYAERTIPIPIAGCGPSCAASAGANRFSSANPGS
ncbi:hypothetical protein XMM379_002693 [Aliiroseovarius sp. xm-m-379]|uniref:hypothetical protein n=1 Tax=unclassified Aliiroseovarius TaxID=2623558 RepID=UPI001568C0C9|nr:MULTISPECIES: hypothetical protein [unclassified Aliiroseovarius]NRP13332.1 hypothetical protein [Aliiroseovarius sp. xm-d-517]NRP25987.1 hypothetical protein [Aliiroseovarius sp. xm-m-379]NRP30354.1 hypothetical protein [Aliiroseovarius sp. xm-m-314]NRP34786.1 hypothetical protein [Aliiroseovarius sp. xm-a-104]NRP40193.1 hypothetical protein [Aliiroseovarius sp. xm-m-339-2]